MTPTWIPCMTGARWSNHEQHLYSPSIRNPLVRAKRQTIVDCLTFGLVKNKHLDAFKHYTWYIDFVAANQEDSSLIFVAPDFDWLPEYQVQKLTEAWVSKDIYAMCLVIPETVLFDKTNLVVGHALKPGQYAPVHPEWTHSFSRSYVPIFGDTNHWTYDSLAN